MPVEEMARRGRETLRFGPMKPVGLPDPRTGREPYAVVQLRREDRAGQMWNLVGFQTRLRIPEQQRVFRMLPGSARRSSCATAASTGTRTSTVRPRSGQALTARDDDRLFFAGQLTGVEGYTESSAPGCSRGSTSRACSRAAGRGAAADHDARRAVPLPARGRPEALPADERELRAARAAGAGPGDEGSEEGAAGRAGAGGVHAWLTAMSLVPVSSERSEGAMTQMPLRSAQGDAAGPVHPEVTEFLTHLEKERDQSPHTVKAYRRDLEAFTEFCDRHYGGRWKWASVDRLGMRGLPRRAAAPRAVQADRGAGALGGAELLPLPPGASRRARTRPPAPRRCPRSTSGCPTYLDRGPDRPAVRVGRGAGRRATSSARPATSRSSSCSTPPASGSPS